MAQQGLIEADLAVLGAVDQRYAGTDAERRMLDKVRERLPEGVSGRVEGLVGHPMPLLILGVHGVLLCLGGGIGWWYPGVGALICLIVSVSLLGEGSGRAALLRFWLPRTPSYNLVIPPVQEGALGTVVLATPLDIPRSRAIKAHWWRRPVAGVFLSGVVLTVLLLLRALSEPLGTTLIGLYAVALTVNAIAGTLVFISRREPRRTSSDAGGPAAALELVRRLHAAPLEGVTVWTVFTGCGRAHQEGMTAFLQLRGKRLAKPILVLSMQDVGRAPLEAAVTEGPLWPQHHRPTGPALVERLRWAGLRLAEVDRPEPSDARAAMILGYRALSLTGGDGAPSAEAVARAADVVETVLRWYREDLAQLPEDRSAVARWATAPEVARS